MPEQVVMLMESGECSHCDPPKRSGAASIKASVGRGGRNLADDVKAIQSALNAQDAANGGRGPGVPLAVDGVVGPLTIAAIEKYQRRQLGWADGRVDPDGPTIRALGGGRGAVAPQEGGAANAPQPQPKATAAQNKAFIERIGGLLPRARHWIDMAQIKIDMASDFLRKGPVNPKDPFPSLHDIGKPDLALFNKYFHSDKQPHRVQLEQLRHVSGIYDLMRTVLTESLLAAPMFGWGVGYFQPDPADGTVASMKYVAYTFFGGWQRRRRDGTPRRSGDDNYDDDGTLREDSIFFPVGKLLTRTDNALTKTIIHELAHFVGPGGPKNGNRIDDYTNAHKTNFLTVNNWTALHTADLYGYFAAESALHHLTIPIP